MDEIKLKKLCQRVLDISYQNISIIEFRAFPTQKFDDEKNEWMPNSHTLYITLKKTPPNYNDSDYNFIKDSESYLTVQNFLESILGFECCVDFV